jgi:DNA-binding NtrC family response regulator
MILLIDDDNALVNMLAYTLNQQGYNTQIAHDFTSLKTQLNTHNFETFVLDMGLPPQPHSLQEGLRCLEHLSQSYPTIPVIVLTGQDAEQAAYESIKLGAFDFLAKPVEPEQLLHAIQRALLFHKTQQKLQQNGHYQIRIDAHHGEGVKSIRNQAEEKLIKSMLIEKKLEINEVASRLHLKREHVYYLIKKYQIER